MIPRKQIRRIDAALSASADRATYRAYTAGPLNDEPVEADFISAHPTLAEAQAAVEQARKGGGWVWEPTARRLWREAGRKTLKGPIEWEEMDAERLGVRKAADGVSAANGVLGGVLPAARSEVAADRANDEQRARDGYVTVPQKPTEKMLKSGSRPERGNALGDPGMSYLIAEVAAIWSAMLAAADPVPAPICEDVSCDGNPCSTAFASPVAGGEVEQLREALKAIDAATYRWGQDGKENGAVKWRDGLANIQDIARAALASPGDRT